MDKSLTPSPPNIPDIVSVAAVAKAWGVKPETLRTWARRGKLQSVKIGRLVFFRVDELRRLCGEDE